MGNDHENIQYVNRGIKREQGMSGAIYGSQKHDKILYFYRFVTAKSENVNLKTSIF